MSFLNRLFGSRDNTATAPIPESGRDVWYTVPEGGYFEVAGVSHHYAALAEVFPPRPSDDDPLTVETPATIERERNNTYDPNAVAVRLHGRLAGYIPRQHAAVWAAFLDRLEAEGYRARATARVWIGNRAYYVNLRADEGANYQTPSERRAEQEAEAAEREARAAERAARADAKAQREALEAERRAAGVCLSCGRPIDRTGQRGRPALRCADCRAQGANA